MSDSYENYEECAYCTDCDSSYTEDELEILAVDQWGDLYICPHGHVYLGVVLSDAYYDLGMYLLSIADEWWVLPEYMRPLPKYE